MQKHEAKNLTKVHAIYLLLNAAEQNMAREMKLDLMTNIISKAWRVYNAIEWDAFECVKIGANYQAGRLRILLQTFSQCK